MDRFARGINPLATSTPMKSVVGYAAIQKDISKIVSCSSSFVEQQTDEDRYPEHMVFPQANTKKTNKIVFKKCILCSQTMLEDRLGTHLREYHRIWSSKVFENIMKGKHVLRDKIPKKQKVKKKKQ